ncbi:MAG: hypothetical protein LBC18_00805, partial [Opitutaceae bacterium]|nr:hypothetical protein [Opitutaceae bacterium]
MPARSRIPFFAASLSAAIAPATATVPAAPAAPLVAQTFAGTPFGTLPEDWLDRIDHRPTRNWAVDEFGLLRVILKEYVGSPAGGDRLRRREYLEKNGMTGFAGLLTYAGPIPASAATPGDTDPGPAAPGHAATTGPDPAALADAAIALRFRKTPDEDVFVSALLRLRDRHHHYSARVSGQGRLEIILTSGKTETILSAIAPVKRLSAGSRWTLEFSARGPLLAARLLDEKGALVSSTWAATPAAPGDKAAAAAANATGDAPPAEGAAGISATTFG